MDTCQDRLVASFDQGKSGDAPANGAVNLSQLEEEIVAMREADTLNGRIGVVILCACAFADQGAYVSCRSSSALISATVLKSSRAKILARSAGRSAARPAD